MGHTTNKINFFNTGKLTAGLSVVALAATGIASSDASAMRAKSHPVKQGEKYEGAKLQQRSERDVQEEQRLRDEFRKQVPQASSEKTSKKLTQAARKEIVERKKVMEQESGDKEATREMAEAKRSLATLQKNADQAIKSLQYLLDEAQSSKFPTDAQRVGTDSTTAMWELERGIPDLYPADRQTASVRESLQSLVNDIFAEGAKIGIFTKNPENDKYTRDSKSSVLSTIRNAKQGLFPDWGKYEKAQQDYKSLHAKYASAANSANSSRNRTLFEHNGITYVVEPLSGSAKTTSSELPSEIQESAPRTYAEFESKEAQSIRKKWRSQASKDIQQAIDYCSAVKNICAKQLTLWNVVQSESKEETQRGLARSLIFADAASPSTSILSRWGNKIFGSGKSPSTTDEGNIQGNG